MSRYTVFDVETPNSYNHRMSAVGVCVVEDGAIVKSWSTLVNPECSFDAFNISLTGITPEEAAQGPTFPELWPRLRADFDGSVLVAHNAPFDMSVLCKCLRHYGIAWQSSVPYACTCRMGRVCYPNLPNHKLNTLCDYCGIPLDHHRAGSDSEAAARLLLDYGRHGLDPQRFVRRYSLAEGRTWY